MPTNAEHFHEMHQGANVLLLANCWDAGSARLLEALGARAVATTSAGLAWTHGYPDGQALSIKELVAAVTSISRVLTAPLSVDLEAGYSDNPDTVGENAAAVIDAGAVGINLEDGTGPADLLAAKIERVRRAADRAGVRLFINARADVYLRNLVDEKDQLAETLKRGALYRSAGADGFFVPKVLRDSDIQAITQQVQLPLNVLAWKGLPGPEGLAALGVRRLSSGSAIAQATWGRARAAAKSFLESGSPDSLFDGAMVSSEMNGLFSAR